MKWLLMGRLRRWSRLQKKADEAPGNGARQLRQARADFSARWQAVFAACEELAPVSGETPLRLARQYMTQVLAREQSPAWWQENAPYLAQPWFIYRYGCAGGLLTPPPPAAQEPPPLLIRPEKGRQDSFVHLQLTRETAFPDHGWLTLSYPGADETFQALMRAQRLWLRDSRYVRRIGETGAPLMDRAVETGVALLEAGYSLWVEEPTLEARILRRQFSPEQRYWVLAPPQRDRLRLSYPRDPRLHQYVCRAGAQWNGRAMEISIRYAARVEELMRLYGFRASQAARKRLDAWNEAVLQATVYRERKRKSGPPGPETEDLFKKLLEKQIDVIEDLRETDE